MNLHFNPEECYVSPAGLCSDIDMMDSMRTQLNALNTFLNNFSAIER